MNPFTVTIPAGKMAGSATFDLLTIDDADTEGPETVLVGGLHGVAYGPWGVLDVLGTEVLIEDNERGQKEIILSVDQLRVAEGGSDQTVTVTATLPGMEASPVLLGLNLADGTAKAANKDYTALTGNVDLLIPAGQTRAIVDVTVAIPNDTAAEQDKTVLLRAFAPFGFEASPSEFAITIADDDASITPLDPARCDDGTFVEDTSNTALIADCKALVDIRNHFTAHPANQNLPTDDPATSDVDETHVLRAWGATGYAPWPSPVVSPTRLAGRALDSMFETRDIRIWPGVTLERVGGVLRVTGINLHNQGLKGLVPVDSIHERCEEPYFSLSSTPPCTNDRGESSNFHYTARRAFPILPSAEAEANRISGTVPAQIGDLAALTRLDLGGNRLTGPLPAPVLSAGLTSLVLSGNDLALADLDVTDLTGLSELRAGGNRLTSWPVGLNANLEILDLSDTGLTGALPSGPSGVTTLTGLTYLDLSGNGFTGALLSDWGGLEELAVLVLSDNQLTGPIPATWRTLTKLERLDLGGNRLTGAISSQFRSRWDDTPGATRRLGWGSLTDLDLSGNQFSGEIPAWVGGLADLERLNLSDNDFSWGLPRLEGSTGLVYVNLSNNRLQGSVPSAWAALTGLQQLRLGGNRLSGPFPAWVGRLPDLRHLHLNDNRLTGLLPASLGDLDLIHLDLSGNRLRGPVPASWAALTGLTMLNLGGNRLTGPIPAALGGFTGLTLLDLGGNQFAGSIPAALTSLTRLRVLDLGGNRLTGPIPARIGDLSRLEKLSLGDNGLTGGLPASFSSLTELTHFDAGGNPVLWPTGGIPAGVLGVTTWPSAVDKLTFLDLSETGMASVFPAGLETLDGLTYLDLSGNRLTGPLPVAVSSLTKLRTLLASDNRFTGSVPSAWGSLSPAAGGSLSRLGFCGNGITGPLPLLLRSGVELVGFPSGARETGACAGALAVLTVSPALTGEEDGPVEVAVTAVRPEYGGPGGNLSERDTRIFLTLLGDTAVLGATGDFTFRDPNGTVFQPPQPTGRVRLTSDAARPLPEGTAADIAVTASFASGAVSSRPTRVSLRVGAEGDVATPGDTIGEGDFSYRWTGTTAPEVVIPAGQNSAAVTLRVSPFSDGKLEGTESFTIAGSTADCSLGLGRGDCSVGSTQAAIADPGSPIVAEVVIPAGKRSGTATLEVTPVDDAASEPVVEKLRVVGEAGSLPVVGTEFRIVDDESAPTEVEWTLNPTSVEESAGEIGVEVTASLADGGVRSDDTAVSFSVGKSTDSAVAGTDYQVVADFTAVIPAGTNRASAAFSLSGTADLLDEPAESLTVSVSVPAGLTADADQRTLALTDADDTPQRLVLTVDADPDTTGTQSTLAENAGTRRVTVTAAFPAGAQVSSQTRTVATATIGGQAGLRSTATRGEDFTAASQVRIVIPPGSRRGSASFDLEVIDDSVTSEGNETISVVGTITEGPAFPFDNTSLTITDNDSGIVLSITPDQGSEGSSAVSATVTAAFEAGTTPPAVPTQVTVTVGSPGDSAVRRPADDPATTDVDESQAGDFSAPATLTIVIPANTRSATAPLAFQLRDDLDVEQAETISLTGTAAGHAVSPTVFTIEASDPYPTSVILRLNVDTTHEPVAGVRTFTTSLIAAFPDGSPPLTRDLLVNASVVTVTEDTASYRSDFQPRDNLALTIPAGSTSASADFSLVILGDEETEGAETLTISGRAAGLAVVPARLTITDPLTIPDSAVLRVSPDEVSENAADHTQVITVSAELSAGVMAPAGGVTIVVTVAGGTEAGQAEEGAAKDFTATAPANISISAGQSTGSTTFRLTVKPDDIAEGDETISVSGVLSGLAATGVSDTTVIIPGNDGTIPDLNRAHCGNGTYVGNPGGNSGLVSDCQTLVDIRNHWMDNPDNADLPADHPLRTWGGRIETWAGLSFERLRIGHNHRRRVTKLELGGSVGSRIRGTLPSEVHSLEGLTHLVLKDNQLIGHIPSQLGSMNFLEVLDLRNNQLSGAIPASITSLPGGSYRFDLQELRLQNNRLSGSVPAWSSTADNYSLRHVDLSGNELTGSMAGFEHLTGLSYLDLSQNRLSGAIPADFVTRGSGALNTLRLNDNNLSGSIPNLSRLPDLKTVDLSGNRLSGSLTGLRHDHLTDLNVSDNQFSGSLPNLPSLPFLERLDLSGNRFTGLLSAWSVTQAPRLNTLDLSDNQLSGTIPSWIGRAGNLVSVDLGNNNLSGPIPPWLTSRTRISRLVLSGNQLTGLIPDSVGNMTSLTELDLHDNRFRGPVPSSLGRLRNLVGLYLDDNQLTGPIPDEIGALAFSPGSTGRLRRFSFCGNNLTGFLPGGLRNPWVHLEDSPSDSGFAYGPFANWFAPVSDCRRAVELSVDRSVSEWAARSVEVTATLAGFGGSIGRPMPDEDTEVTVSVEDGTAFAPGDYAVVNPFKITIPVGETSANGSFTLTPVNDSSDFEGDETVRVDGAGETISVTGTDLAIIDARRAIDGIIVTASPSVIPEGETTRVTITASIPDHAAPETNTQIRFRYLRTVDGTATKGTDFTDNISGEFRISPNQRSGSRDFNISATENTTAEADKTFYVYVTPYLNRDVVRFRNRIMYATVTIANNDILPALDSAICNNSAVVPAGNSALARQCRALVAIRNHWTNRLDNAGLPATHPLLDWNGSSSIETWPGVTVSIPSGGSSKRVTGLDLSADSDPNTADRISGAIPSFGWLSDLTSLDLSGNLLTGSIPAVSLPSTLTSLDLSGNQLSGSIPDRLRRLTALTSLDLSDNQLTGSIPTGIGALTALTSLDLSDNQLTGAFRLGWVL